MRALKVTIWLASVVFAVCLLAWMQIGFILDGTSSNLHQFDDRGAKATIIVSLFMMVGFLFGAFFFSDDRSTPAQVRGNRIMSATLGVITAPLLLLGVYIERLNDQAQMDNVLEYALLLPYAIVISASILLILAIARALLQPQQIEEQPQEVTETEPMISIEAVNPRSV